MIGRDRIEVLPETSMVTRADRLQHFIIDADPPFGSVVEVLCEDHVGTYRLALVLPQHARGPPERAHGRVDRGTGDRLARAEATDLNKTADGLAALGHCNIRLLRVELATVMVLTTLSSKSLLHTGLTTPSGSGTSTIRRLI